MQTRLIEVIPDIVDAEESWTDWATRNVKENGWKAAGAAVIATPILPAAVGTVAVGAGLVSGVQNGIAWLRGSDNIEKLEFAKAQHLHDEHGQPVELNKIYAVHPDEARSKLVIAAPEFHNIIVSEQIADLVSFIRGTVRASAIHISVESAQSGALGATFWSRFSAKADTGVTKHHSVELEYAEPEIIPLPEKPFWLHTFPEIVAAFQGAKKGSVKRSVSVDTTFGLTASLAEQAGIDASWLGKQRFNFQASFA